MQVLTPQRFRSWAEAWDVSIEGSVCCWNICSGFSEDMKRPRAYVRKSTATESRHDTQDSSVPLVGTPVRPSLPNRPVKTGQQRHVTNRLLVETVAPDRHLVFNPLSGAVDLATDADLACLEGLRHGKATVLTPDQEMLLRTRGYLFDGPDEEEACMVGAVAAAWARMAAAQPQMYTVCPTLACNLACAYCFEGDSLVDKRQGVMTADQVAQAFDAIGNLRAGFARTEGPDALPPWIALFGGEPLLPSTRGCVAEILRRAAADGFLVAATTNGVNLTRFEDLLTEYADILTVFQVTLDGPKAVHDARRHRLGGQGTFDEVVRGIDLLLFLGIDVDLRVNLDADNVGDLPALVDFLHERGWIGHPAFALALAPITVHGEEGGCRSRYDRALTELELARRVMALAEAHPRVAETCHLGFLRHLEYLVGVLEPERLGIGRRGTPRAAGPRYWYCEASTDKQYVFTPEGLIYSCTEAVGQPAHAVGRFVPSLELWGEECGEWVGRTILSHPQCRACSISTLCGGGCHMGARARSSAPEPLLQIDLPASTGMRRKPGPANPAERNRPDPFCNGAEETVRAYLRSVWGVTAGRDQVSGLLGTPT
jgi:uncharacterized protein